MSVDLKTWLPVCGGAGREPARVWRNVLQQEVGECGTCSGAYMVRVDGRLRHHRSPFTTPPTTQPRTPAGSTEEATS